MERFASRLPGARVAASAVTEADGRLLLEAYVSSRRRDTEGVRRTTVGLTLA